MVNQKDQIIKFSLASLQHLIDAVRYVAQMYKVELRAYLIKSEFVFERGYFVEKCLENPMILSLK